MHYRHEYLQMQPNFMLKEFARHIWNVFPIDDENQQMSEFHSHFDANEETMFVRYSSNEFNDLLE